VYVDTDPYETFLSPDLYLSVQLIVLVMKALLSVSPAEYRRAKSWHIKCATIDSASMLIRSQSWSLKGNGP
jgi:hypothetical protein